MNQKQKKKKKFILLVNNGLNNGKNFLDYYANIPIQIQLFNENDTTILLTRKTNVNVTRASNQPSKVLYFSPFFQINYDPIKPFPLCVIGVFGSLNYRSFKVSPIQRPNGKNKRK